MRGIIKKIVCLISQFRVWETWYDSIF